jgi:6-pyruvoyl-tetrahydropterin synthase
MIVDFSLIKQVLVDPIKEGLDHYVLNERKLGRSLFKNPTAENIASAIMHWGQAEILKYLTLPVGIYLQQVRVYETPDNYATVSRELDEPGRGIG